MAVRSKKIFIVAVPSKDCQIMSKKHQLSCALPVVVVVVVVVASLQLQLQLQLQLAGHIKHKQEELRKKFCQVRQYFANWYLFPRLFMSSYLTTCISNAIKPLCLYMSVAHRQDHRCLTGKAKKIRESN